MSKFTGQCCNYRFKFSTLRKKNVSVKSDYKPCLYVEHFNLQLSIIGQLRTNSYLINNSEHPNDDAFRDVGRKKRMRSYKVCSFVRTGTPPDSSVVLWLHFSVARLQRSDEMKRSATGNYGHFWSASVYNSVTSWFLIDSTEDVKRKSRAVQTLLFSVARCPRVTNKGGKHNTGSRFQKERVVTFQVPGFSDVRAAINSLPLTNISLNK